MDRKHSRTASVSDPNGWNGFAASLDLHGPKDDTGQKRARVALGPGVDDLQRQLLSANERIHGLEAFTQQQEAWLDEERREHAETDRRLREAEWHKKEADQRLAEERALHAIQVSVIPGLEEHLRTAARNAETHLIRETVRLTQGFQHALAAATKQMKKEADTRLAREVEVLCEHVAQTEMTLEMVQQEATSERDRVLALTTELATERDRVAALTVELAEEKVGSRNLFDKFMVATRTANAEAIRVHTLTCELREAQEALAESRKETDEACCEVNRMGEALAQIREQKESGPSPVLADGMLPALQSLVQLAFKLGDPHADSPALTEVLNYVDWHAAVEPILGASDLSLAPLAIGGAAQVIGTLVPILYSLYVEVGQHNGKLIHEYDAVAARCKELEAELAKCKCPELKAHIAQLEKEMCEAEDLVNKQNGVNKDLHIRVQHRTALEQVKIDGAPLLQGLVMAQDQRRQLEMQVSWPPPLSLSNNSGSTTQGPDPGEEPGLVTDHHGQAQDGERGTGGQTAGGRAEDPGPSCSPLRA